MHSDSFKIATSDEMLSKQEGAHQETLDAANNATKRPIAVAEQLLDWGLYHLCFKATTSDDSSINTFNPVRTKSSFFWLACFDFDLFYKRDNRTR